MATNELQNLGHEVMNLLGPDGDNNDDSDGDFVAAENLVAATNLNFRNRRPPGEPPRGQFFHDDFVLTFTL